MCTFVVCANPPVASQIDHSVAARSFVKKRTSIWPSSQFYTKFSDELCQVRASAIAASAKTGVTGRISRPPLYYYVQQTQADPGHQSRRQSTHSRPRHPRFVTVRHVQPDQGYRRPPPSRSAATAASTSSATRILSSVCARVAARVSPIAAKAGALPAMALTASSSATAEA